jgi:hypothetical protein
VQQVAVERATARLERAKRALAEFGAAKSYADAEVAWTDFILSASNIFNKLEQGAKGNGESTGWYGRQKDMRGKDPVMRYLHHARNSDEHGLQLVTLRQLDGSQNQAFGERTDWIVRAVDEKTGELGEPHQAWMYGPHLKLAPVRDRGVLYEPPYAAVSPPGDPAAVATYAIGVLETLIAEAAELAGLVK